MKHAANIIRASLLAALGGWLLAPKAQALNIVMNLDVLGTDHPSFDPGVTQLAMIMAAVAEKWEDIIQDAGTVNITYRYKTRTLGLANANLTQVSNGKPVRGDIDVDTVHDDSGPEDNSPIPWYFDPDPTTHEHWDMKQTLFRDLSNKEKTARFGTTTPPDYLEVSYRGLAKSSAPADAANGYDIYTSLLHEVGHILGLTGDISSAEVADGDIDVRSATAGGNVSFDIKMDVGSDGKMDKGHLAGSGDKELMCGSCAETGARRLPSAMDVIAIAELSGWTNIDLPRQDMFIGTDFNRASNWEANSVPSSSDDAYVRHGQAVSLSADAHVDSLYVGYKSRVWTQAHDLTVDDKTTLEKDQTDPPNTVTAPPELQVMANGTFTTTDLDIKSPGIFKLDGGTATISDDLTNDGTVYGEGTLHVNGEFVNNGLIQAVGELLTIIGPGTAGSTPFNLDGKSVNDVEPGRITATAGDILFKGELFDPFGGEITIGKGHYVSFASGWELGTKGRLTLRGGVNASDAERARLLGSSTLRGEITVTGESSIENGTIESDAEVSIAGATDRLAIFGGSVKAGAVFTGAGIFYNGIDSILDVATGAVINVACANAGAAWKLGGTGIGRITTGAFTNGAKGLLQLDLQGSPSTANWDQLTSTGSAKLDGSLKVTFNLTGLIPSGTMRWKVIQSVSRTGGFSSVDFVNTPSGRTASVNYLSDGVEVALTTAFVPQPNPLVNSNIPPKVNTGAPGITPTFDLPAGTKTRITSSDPNVIRVKNGQLTPGNPGTAELIIEWLDPTAITPRKATQTIEVVDTGAAPKPRPAAQADLAAWSRENFGANDPNRGQWNLDDDGDGLTRMQEYLHGTDPRVKNQPALTRIQTRKNAGGEEEVDVVFPVSKRAAKNVSISVEQSIDGRAWEDVDATPEVVAEDAQTSTLCVTRKRAGSLGDEPTGLFRLRYGVATESPVKP